MPYRNRSRRSLVHRTRCYSGAGVGFRPAALEAAGMSKRATRKSAASKRPRAKLDVPDLDHSKAAVLDSLRSPERKRGYGHAMDEFISWYCSEPRLSFNKVVVTRFRIFLENRDLATCGCSPVSVRSCGCGFAQSRVGSQHPASKRPKKLGVGLGNWLTGRRSAPPMAQC